MTMMSLGKGFDLLSLVLCEVSIEVKGWQNPHVGEPNPQQELEAALKKAARFAARRRDWFPRK